MAQGKFIINWYVCVFTYSCTKMMEFLWTMDLESRVNPKLSNQILRMITMSPLAMWKILKSRKEKEQRIEDHMPPLLWEKERKWQTFLRLTTFQSVIEKKFFNLPLIAFKNVFFIKYNCIEKTRVNIHSFLFFPKSFQLQKTVSGSHKDFVVVKEWW